MKNTIDKLLKMGNVKFVNFINALLPAILFKSNWLQLLSKNIIFCDDADFKKIDSFNESEYKVWVENLISFTSFLKRVINLVFLRKIERIYVAHLVNYFEDIKRNTEHVPNKMKQEIFEELAKIRKELFVCVLREYLQSPVPKESSSLFSDFIRKNYFYGKNSKHIEGELKKSLIPEIIESIGLVFGSSKMSKSEIDGFNYSFKDIKRKYYLLLIYRKFIEKTQGEDHEIIALFSRREKRLSKILKIVFDNESKKLNTGEANAICNFLIKMDFVSDIAPEFISLVASYLKGQNDARILTSKDRKEMLEKIKVNSGNLNEDILHSLVMRTALQ